MRFKDTIGITHSLRKLDLRIEATLNECLKSLGLSHPQYTAMSALEETPGMTNADLAVECSVTPQTMNRMVQGLVDSGLIVKKNRKNEVLRVSLHLTKKAEDLICDAHVVVNDIEKKMMRGFSKERINELKAQMEKWESLLQKKD